MEGSSSFDVVKLVPALLRYARTLVHDPAEAEELVHETLLRAYERRATFDHRRDLRPWLFSILHNLFVDGYRRRLMEEHTVQSLSDTDHTFSSATDADTRVQLAELHQAFLRLPEAQRAALHLIAIEGLSYQDAAAALGIPVGTLMSRLSRARAALRTTDQAAENRSAATANPAPLKLIKSNYDAD